VILAMLAALTFTLPARVPGSVYPRDTHLQVNTMPAELATGSRVLVQFISINYSDIVWTSATAYMAVLSDPAGLFPTRKVPIPRGVTVPYIRQCCMTTSLTAPATARACPVVVQMMKSTGVPMGVAFATTVTVRAAARLAAGSLTLSPTTLVPDMSATAAFTVTNRGTTSSLSQTFQLWASPDQTFWSTQSTALFGWQPVVSATGSQPSPRSQAAMVYDERRQRVLLFGGVQNNTYFADTWEYTPPGQGVTPGWRQLNISGPSGRSGHAMAYNAARNKVILFGGYNGQAVLGDTWEYTAAGGWRSVSLAVRPYARQRAAMAYDRKRQTIFLFGGNTGTIYPADTWTYTPTGWTRLTTATAPPGRESGGLAYDSKRDRFIVFSGRGYGLLADMWQFTYAGGWTQLPTPTVAAREGIVMVYDPRRDRMVTFGGRDLEFRAESWEWRDGQNWRVIHTLGPNTRNFYAAAYDQARGKLMIFGGWDYYYLGDTWEQLLGGDDTWLGERRLAALAPGQSVRVTLPLDAAATSALARQAPGQYWVGLLPDGLGEAPLDTQPGTVYLFPSLLTLLARNAATGWWQYW
jgi:hypothetical protein